MRGLFGPGPTDEMVDGNYGGLAARQSPNRGVWFCTDSDYTWKGVVDDYGVIVPITEYVNQRGY